jgi:hypothetical protein
VATHPLSGLAEQLAVMDAFERGRLVHWADPLFRDFALERKVTASLAAEAAAHRRDASPAAMAAGVLLIDLMACGGGIAVVDVLRRTFTDAGEIAYVGFGVPLRGSRGLIERGLAQLARETPGPAVRCAFHSRGFFDLVTMEQAWAEVVDHYDWILAVGFEGRAGRGGAGPLEPDALGRLSFVDCAVISFLDASQISASLPRLALLATSLGQPLEVAFDVLRGGRLDGLGAARVEPGYDQEEARQALGELSDASSRFAHRARLRPCGSLRASGEVVEYVSSGYAIDHLLAGLSVSREVPSGALRTWVIGG